MEWPIGKRFASRLREVDLPGAELMPPWNVSNMDGCDQINILLQAGDQVSFRNLRMVTVIQEADIRPVYLLDNSEPFLCGPQIVLRVLFQIDVLEQQFDA